MQKENPDIASFVSKLNKAFESELLFYQNDKKKYVAENSIINHTDCGILPCLGDTKRNMEMEQIKADKNRQKNAKEKRRTVKRRS